MARNSGYYFHVKKCGGTSLNRWLDLLVSDDRAWIPTAIGPLADRLFDPAGEDGFGQYLRDFDDVGCRAFRLSEMVASHMPLCGFAPPDFRCFTVLREPVARLVSQVSDWRRLVETDTATLTSEMRDCIADAGKLSLREFLGRHAHKAGRHLMNNHMIRAFAGNRIGGLARSIEPVEWLKGLAMDSLHGDFGFVGLLEHQAESRIGIAALLGAVPDPDGARLNVTSSNQTMQAEIEAARDILDELTVHDRDLYTAAAGLLANRYAPALLPYAIEDFERHHAATATRRLHATMIDGDVCFSVRQPLIGSGFHGRDGANTLNCAVWTGPRSGAMLYMPVPQGRRLIVRLWLRGYADERQRSSLRVGVDGHRADHRFVPAENYREIVEIQALSQRDFLRLDIETDMSYADDPSSHQADARIRGLSFDRYGWRVE